MIARFINGALAVFLRTVLGAMDFAMQQLQGTDPSCLMLIQVAIIRSATAKTVPMHLSVMEHIGIK